MNETEHIWGNWKNNHILRKWVRKCEVCGEYQVSPTSEKPDMPVVFSYYTGDHTPFAFGHNRVEARNAFETIYGVVPQNIIEYKNITYLLRQADKLGMESLQEEEQAEVERYQEWQSLLEKKKND